jgi:uncharacterized membrane protein YhiD involved in acid resistance
MPDKVRIDKQALALVAVFGAIVVLSALISYLLLGRPAVVSPVPAASPQTTDRRVAPTTEPSVGAIPQTAPAPATRENNRSFFSQLFGAQDSATPGTPADDWLTSLFKALLRLALAALLSAALAFRPRKFALLFKRNLFVAQTQILLAVVASALMMIVGDSAARAFGIFAAVSLVRFRTNIKDPKEVTILLMSLAVGLATGVGRLELALVLTVFVLLLLWMLEYREPELVVRAMELNVKTRNLVETHEAITTVLKKHRFTSELRALNREDEKDHLGSVNFLVEISPLVSIDLLTDEILSTDKGDIDSMEWNQQKSSAVYQ